MVNRGREKNPFNISTGQYWKATTLFAKGKTREEGRVLLVVGARLGLGPPSWLPKLNAVRRQNS